MAAELIIAPEAEQDLAETYAWYEDRRTGLGEELLSCVDACIEAIRRMPEMHALEVIEQITYLLFIRRLDDLHTLEEQCLLVLANPPFASSLDYENTATVLSVTQQALLAELDALFASLQHRAFRGEL